MDEINKLYDSCLDTSLDDLTHTVERLITCVENYQTFFWPNLVIHGLYRGRTHNHLEGSFKDDKLTSFNNEKEFWNPPIKVLTSYGRCNNIEESILYCSNDWKTAILESRPEHAEYISISIYRPKKNPANPDKLSGSRVMPVGIQYLSQIKDLQECFEKINFQNRKKDFFELDDALDKLFHCDVSEENNHMYKLSIAVTRCMMKNLHMENGTIQQSHGMMYSSMVRNKESYNLIFKPTHARTIFDLYRVQTFRILENSDKEIVLHLVREGNINVIKKHPLDYSEITWNDVSVQNLIEKIQK